jgi:hypothetical protein
MSLTPEERATVERWRPSPSNPTCECSGDRVCAPCALVAVIDRLVAYATVYKYDEDRCPGHVASEGDPKVCGRCGTHVDSLRPEEDC